MMRFQVWVHYLYVTRMEARTQGLETAYLVARSLANQYEVPVSVHKSSRQNDYREIKPQIPFQRSKEPNETYFPDPAGGEEAT
jgi:hypothetical protein